MWYFDVIKKLMQENCLVAVAGGFAVALHGAVRGTIDLDLVMAMEPQNVRKTERTLKELGFVSRIPITAEDLIKFRREYIERRNLIAWSFVNPKNPAQVVDLIITENLKRKDVIKVSVSGLKIPVLTKRALIRMKRKANRPQDIEDIQALEALDEES